jgi:hypothetical protein
MKALLEVCGCQKSILGRLRGEILIENGQFVSTNFFSFAYLSFMLDE